MTLCLSVLSVVLWLGDLNYRISELDVDHVKVLITKKDFETLHNYDQVRHLLLDALVMTCTGEGKGTTPIPLNCGRGQESLVGGG